VPRGRRSGLIRPRVGGQLVERTRLFLPIEVGRRRNRIQVLGTETRAAILTSCARVHQGDDPVRILNGTGCSRNASATLNIAVFAPIPRPALPRNDRRDPVLDQHAQPESDVLPNRFHELPPGSGSDVRFLCFLHDAAVEQMDGAFGKICVALVVRDHAHRSPVAVQVTQQFHDRLAVLRIEVSGRLVSHQNQRIATNARATATRCC